MLKKSQIHPEFLVAVAAVIIIFTIVVLFILIKRTEIRNTEKYLEKRSSCLELANTLSTTFISGNGSSSKIFTSFNMSITESSSLITVESFDSTEDFITCTFEPILIDNNYSDLRHNITIKNINNHLTLTNKTYS